MRAIEGWHATEGGAPKEGRTGSVTATQRFGSALNLNLHFHCIFLDGVYTRGADERLSFRRVVTPPGQQMQVDFGQRRVRIGDEDVVAHPCILTLGYSRRILAIAYACARQSQWLEGIEAAFQHFGGTPVELLVDNARALVSHHDAATREVTFNEIPGLLRALGGVRPWACTPYRARTKGKDERAVQYVGRNAIAGRTFRSWEDFNAHLVRWSREIAGRR